MVLFFSALSQDIYLLGSLDFFALIGILLIIDSRRPGVDNIFGIEDYAAIPQFSKYLHLIMRLGVGVSIAYLAIVEKILNPHLSAFVAETTNLVNVIPVSAQMWTFGAGTVELLIGIFLILGIRTRLSSAIAMLVLTL
ncbi:MAG: putative membrane protein YphA (DoxX/SURF4 family) [Planctomycetota bacterium]|jgi:uncharacterized membrane protein YphA (DoxX/SURF4 family)